MKIRRPLKQIIHLDMDAFYPSVEALDNPELREENRLSWAAARKEVWCHPPHTKPGNSVSIKIKQKIVEKTGLTISAGLAPSKFVAKVASDMEKTDGLTVVPPDKVRGFLDPLPIKKMWGVGKVTQQALLETSALIYPSRRWLF
jgi:nucleotidyltransferase/DNA polymerase involved in DNA repair